MLRRGFAKLILVVAMALALMIAGGIGLFLRTGPPGDAAQGPTVADQALTAGRALPTDALARTIATLQATLRNQPGDARSWAELGFAYVQQARVTADPTFYPKAEGAVRRSLALQPNGNVDAFAGMGSLAAARHDFAGALSWGERARAVNPYNATIRAIVGDALIELGGTRRRSRSSSG